MVTNALPLRYIGHLVKTPSSRTGRDPECFLDSVVLYPAVSARDTTDSFSHIRNEVWCQDGLKRCAHILQQLCHSGGHRRVPPSLRLSLSLCQETEDLWGGAIPWGQGWLGGCKKGG